jgi:predicted glycoside hydrolase/deacetylase ChbG (UPF0249 family)
MAREVRAQFQRFAATGLPLDHVDAHQHLHMHPAVFGAVLQLAGQYGAGGIRLPRDDFWLAVRYDQRDAGVKAVWTAVFGILCRRYAGDLAIAKPRLAVTDRVYGLMQSGRMEEGYVLRVLSSAGAAAAELYFHPTLAPESLPLGPNRADLATLLSPEVRQAIEERGWVRASYTSLKEAR